MFKALIGDLFASQAQTRVNTVNCIGIMGKGVAQEFKNTRNVALENKCVWASRIFTGIVPVFSLSIFQPRIIGVRHRDFQTLNVDWITS
jgi:hypothetical protein